MKRPLPITLIFMIIGIFAGQYAAEAFVPFLALICLLCIFVFALYKNAAYSLIFMMMFVAGFMGVSSKLIENPILSEYSRSGQVLTLSGNVLDSSKTQTGNQKIILWLTGIADGEKTIDCGMLKVKVQVIINGENVPEPVISQNITLSGRLEPLAESRNPGGYNEMLHLRGRGISYKSYSSLISIGTEPGQSGHLKVFTEKLKNRLVEIFDAALPLEEAGIIKAMLVGDKTGLDSDTADIYREVGIYHILAISGLHLSIFGLVFDLLLCRVLGRKISGVATVFLLIAYCVMVGCPVSAVRATVMTSIAIFGRLIKRPSDLASSASLAAICLLSYQPFYLWDIGFQYSFSAVFGIAYLSEPIKDVLFGSERDKRDKTPMPLRYLESNLPAALAATVATTPVLAWHFYYFPVYAVIVNILIVPSVFIVLTMALVVAVLGFISIELSYVLAGPIFFILKIYEAVAGFFAGLPFSTLLTGCPPLLAIILWLMGGIVLASKVFKNRRVLISTAFFIAAAVSVIVILHIPEGFIVDMLDVGQGDCIVISMDKRTYIVDGGGSRLGGSTGARVIKPYLDYRGISRIEAVFISHFDADHIGGVLEILDLKTVGHVFITDPEAAKLDEEGYFYLDELISLVDRNRIPIEIISAGDIVKAGSMNLYCLSPRSGASYKNINAASLVLRLEHLDYGGFGLLVTGDIDQLTEADIISREADISSDILKLAHHGSKYSNSEAFISEVNPLAAIVGTGKNNSYGHPSAEVRDILNSMGIPLYNTAEYGMIRIRISKGQIIINGHVR